MTFISIKGELAFLSFFNIFFMTNDVGSINNAGSFELSRVRAGIYCRLYNEDKKCADENYHSSINEQR